jgi:hypothetical protein
MKNSLLFLSFLLLTIGISAQTQINSEKANANHVAKSSKKSEKIFFRHADQCLQQIEVAARKISIKGVAIIAFIPGDTTKTWISKMKVVDNLTSGKSNLLGIAYTKASEMADTHLNSGSKSREIYSGELGYQGGLIKKVRSGYLLAVFSGGSGEQDIQVANVGLEWISKFYQ